MSLRTSNLLASFLMCSLHESPKPNLPGGWLFMDVGFVVVTEDMEDEESVQKLANFPVLKQYSMPGWSSLLLH